MGGDGSGWFDFLISGRVGITGACLTELDGVTAKGREGDEGIGRDCPNECGGLGGLEAGADGVEVG